MPRRAPLPLPIVPTPPRVTCERPPRPHPDEFPRDAATWDESVSRRRFLTLAGAGLALAGVTGCGDRPDEPIVPYVDPPESTVVGEPQFFATTLTRQGYGRGVIVTCREGRPVKIEGNPDHPASLGAADAQTQAAVLGLYDPLRSRAVTHAGGPATFGAFQSALAAQLATHAADGGAGLVVLTGATSSPTFAALRARLRERLPGAAWLQHEPVDRRDAARSVGMTTGRRGEAVYDLSACDVVVSFDNDFLTDEPGSLAYARQFAAKRRPTADRPTMSRLYVAESDVSLTGTRADHRLAVPPRRVEVLVAALSAQVGLPHAMPTDLTPAEAAWLSAVAGDLNASRGRCLVLAGPTRPPRVQAAALAITRAFGGFGRTVRFTDAVLQGDFDPGSGDPAGESPTARANALTVELDAGRVRTLLILADNPVRTTPADHPLADKLAELSRRPGVFTAHLGLYANETAFNCQWHVPMRHELESWSDARAFDGTASVVQPAVAPATAAWSAIDLMNLLLGRPDRSAYDTVRDHWRQVRGLGGGAFEAWWADALRRGTIDTPAGAPNDEPFEPRLPPLRPAAEPVAATAIDVVLRPDPSIGDGSLFHNPWLQELPRPMSKIVWGNAALVSPATARRTGVADEDVVRLEKDGRAIEVPAVVVPGVADDTVVLHLGYGTHRVVGGDTAWAESNLPYGVDAYPLRTSDSPGFTAGVTLTPLAGRTAKVVRTHNHHGLSAKPGEHAEGRRMLTPQVVATPDTPEADLRLRNRKLIRTATLTQFAAKPDFAPAMDEGEIKQLYPAWDYGTGPQWGMTIDLNACIGCNACVVACQAENNTPSVGADQVDKQREMHWLRIDQYAGDDGRVHHQPVLCMHCENAPCEYVCPVAATTHSVDGLNQMTYNRCVGTRYCSNNCPYKVRRFNFLNYTFYTPEQYKMQKNPDVTVRTRGVMEKCTYCVQRLVYADRKIEIAALDAGGDTTQLKHDSRGRVQTACQQTCPTRAIEFGDIAYAESAVAKNKKDPRNYGILVELSTKPRTTYLAAVTHPSPAMAEGGGA